MVSAKRTLKDSCKLQHTFEGACFEYICLNMYHQMLSIKQYKCKGGEPWLEKVGSEEQSHSSSYCHECELDECH